MTVGDRNWREYVGPAGRWDSQAAMQFTTLVGFGLREKHRLCDVGCGSLRAGRLFIPYLEAGSYFGIEPEAWLVEDGLRLHVGEDLVGLRSPQFIVGRRDFPIQAFGVDFNFILAQSVLTHATQEQVHEFLGNAAAALAPGGIILATWAKGNADANPKEWQYPQCVGYTNRFMDLAGVAAGLQFSEYHNKVLDLVGCWGVWRKK